MKLYKLKVGSKVLIDSGASVQLLQDTNVLADTELPLEPTQFIIPLYDAEINTIKYERLDENYIKSYMRKFGNKSPNSIEFYVWLEKIKKERNGSKI